VARDTVIQSWSVGNIGGNDRIYRNINIVDYSLDNTVYSHAHRTHIYGILRVPELVDLARACSNLVEASSGTHSAACRMLEGWA